MPDTTQVTIIVQPPAQVNVTASAAVATGSPATQASGVTYAGGTGLSEDNVEAALDTLAHRSFSQTTAPTGGTVIEGDTWYDTDDNIMYVRRDSTWTELITDASDVDGGEYS